MMDREKRRNIIRKIVRFWFKHNLAIAISLAAVFIITTVTVLYVCVMDIDRDEDAEPDADTAITATSQYAGVFDDDSDAGVNRKKKTNAAVTAGTEQQEEEIEYSTILKYNESTRPGYMNNCIFLGDSRTVAMVSYGFVSDENVLAKVGISHTSVMNSKFMQNSGREYTIDSYLSSHKAPVIYLGFGVNGMNGISEDKYEKTYKDMVESIMKKAPDSDIVLMAIWPVDDNGPYKNSVQNSWINKYNEFLKTLAEYEGIYYLDVDTILKGSDGQIKPEYNAGDGLHYRACAYTVILEYIIHHPVVGVPDDGEFVVKYVKPTGQFKNMMKEPATLPPNVQVVDDSAQVTTAPTNEGENTALPSPSPTVKVEQTNKKVTPSPSPAKKPTPKPEEATPTKPPVAEEPTKPPAVTPPETKPGPTEEPQPPISEPDPEPDPEPEEPTAPPAEPEPQPTPPPVEPPANPEAPEE